MERTLTYEEKIRRAEEIYARRNKNNMGYITKVPIRENKKKSMLKKMMIQMLVCVVMYSIFYLINNSDYNFSEQVTKNTKGVLSYDVDLVKLYKDISLYFQNIINEEENKNFQEKTENKEILDKTEGQEQAGIIEEQKQPTDIEEVTETEEKNNEEKIEEETKPLSQMEIDANEIKKIVSFILPLNGVISSEFGEREVNNSLITPEHYGIDIAANEGTEIKAAMEGKVVIANYSSSYR